MPSLPELEVYKRTFTNELLGSPIAQVEPMDFRVVHADLHALEQVLIGHTITSINRYGKWLYFDLGQPQQLIIHLGLTGKLRLLPPEDKPPRYLVLSVKFNDGRQLVMSDQRHIGKVYVRNFNELKAEKKLGPDFLDVTEDYFADVLAKRKRGVRDVLMDQHAIAGIGGKYADEILWQAKVHPNTKIDNLTRTQVAAVYQLARSITDTAIALDGDVERFPGTWLIPHRHTDQVCPRCSGPLTERSSGGSAAVYCPHCQTPPNPSRSG